MPKTIRYFKSILVALAGGFLFLYTVPSALAQDKHPMLLDLQTKGYTVDYLGQALGLDGWVIRNAQDQAQYAYTTSEGGLIMGLLFDHGGEIHTAKQVQEMRDIIKGNSQAAAPIAKSAQSTDKVSRAERLYAEVEGAYWFGTQNTDAPYIYTFINPTCDHCAEYWRDHMKSLVDDGSLQVRFIPFGAGWDNKSAAAALLQAEKGIDLWNTYTDDSDHSVLTSNVQNIKAATWDQVKYNTQLFAKWNLPTVPFTIYRAPVDGKIKILSGVPTNPMMVLADMVK